MGFVTIREHTQARNLSRVPNACMAALSCSALPFQDIILEKVSGHEMYTFCDGYSGFYQIRIAENDVIKTTFTTPWGTFAFKVMPFGLTNAITTFQHFMQMVFAHT